MNSAGIILGKKIEHSASIIEHFVSIKFIYFACTANLPMNTAVAGELF